MKEKVWLAVFVFFYINVPLHEGKVQISSPRKVNVVNNVKRIVPKTMSTVAKSRYNGHTNNVITGIKNGSITDPNVIFNYLTFETFNWNSQFCLKCLMGDFKVEIGVCYKGQITISSWHKAFSSWYRKSYRVKRSGTTTESGSYDCWWCKKCMK